VKFLCSPRDELIVSGGAMNVFEMVVVVMFLSIVGTVLRTWVKTRSTVQPPDPVQEGRMAALEQRVRALETIVTDHGYDLRKQFKDLEREP
jgi:hypothetical protein